MLIRKLKNAISNLSGKNGAVDLFYTSLKYTMARFMGTVLSDKQYANWFYHLYTGKKIDWDNPKSFDEKIWWLKLYNRDPMLTICSDKDKVRTYVADCGYADILIPQLGVFENANDIPFDRYEQEIVAKCNHNSGGQVFYNPANANNKTDLEFSKKTLNYILRHNAYVLSHEWNYKNIPPKIVVEQVIRDKKGQLPLDYKFMCFDGEPKLLFLDLGVINADGSYNHDYPRNIYDMDFNLMPFHETRPNAPYPVEKPENFEKMVEVARVLSKPFPFCRVDLYNVEGQVYFGEITFYHGGGCNNIQPEEWDLKLGSWIDLQSPKIQTERKQA